LAFISGDLKATATVTVLPLETLSVCPMVAPFLPPTTLRSRASMRSPSTTNEFPERGARTTPCVVCSVVYIQVLLYWPGQKSKYCVAWNAPLESA